MITEDQLKQLALQWFQDTGWDYAEGPTIAPDGDRPERADYRAVVLLDRLAEAVATLNPQLPASAVEEVVHVVHTRSHPSLAQNNRAFHRASSSRASKSNSPTPPGRRSPTMHSSSTSPPPRTMTFS